MQKITLYLFLTVLACTGIIVSCQLDVNDADPMNLIQQDEAQLIQYSSSPALDGRYIVVFKETAVPEVQSRAITGLNYKQIKADFTAKAEAFLTSNKVFNKTIDQSYVKALKGIALELNDQELNALQNDDSVDYIEQDQIITVSMGGPPGGGGGGGDPTQTTPWGTTRVGGAINGANAGAAWILDSGIDLDHPDLNVDVSRSVSFLGGNQANNPDDQNGHGTHVAGTIGAIDNNIGSVGVAEGASVISVRVLDRRGSGSTSGVIAGVDHVAANAASGDVANMSLGGGVSTTLDNAVINAAGGNGCNCPFVLAAGNESQHANNSSPARANGSNIYTVSSMTSSDTWSSFSNYGNPPVDYCAPGSSIYSTYKGGGYATLSGTSMASPHVAGILLIGGITSDGTVSGDPDGNPDPIAHH